MTLALDVPPPAAIGSRSIDTDPHPRFKLYSAGNFAEVAPERLSVVSWSAVGPPQERAMRALAARLWPAATWATGSAFAFVGYFGCRPFHNLSALCHMAEQVPRLTADQFTACYFEGAHPPRTRTAVVSRLRRYAAMPRLMREVRSLRCRQTREQGRVVELEALARDALATGSAIALGECVARARQTLADAWEVHMAATACLPALRAIQRTVGERATPFWDELEPWVNRPPELVWSSLHAAAGADRDLGAGEFLGAPFYEIADAHEPWARYATPPPRPAAAAPALQQRVDPGEAFWSMPGQGASRALHGIACLVGDTMTTRELSKSLVMRALHVLRRLLPPVAAAQRLAPADWPYLTVDEIAGAHRLRELDSLADARREECSAALAEPVPELVDFGASESVTPGPPAAGGGRGISGGSVTGVIVGADLEGAPPGAPRILAAEALDAEAQRVLASVDGVLTARGSLLSHVAILVRERGIPAVAGHPLARAVRPGDAITLNGSTGEVARVG